MYIILNISSFEGVHFLHCCLKNNQCLYGTDVDAIHCSINNFPVMVKNSNLTLEGPYIIFAIYVNSSEIHNVVALMKCLLVLRCQLYMFRTVTVHPQELLCRNCMRRHYGTC